MTTKRETKLHSILTLATVTALVLGLTACGGNEPTPTAEGADPVSQAPIDLDPIAEAYVRLVLDVGQHDGDYVDAYYGPEEWKTAAAAQTRPLAEIRQAAAELVDDLGDETASGDDELVALRWHYLRRQLEALIARVDLLDGAEWSFDQEAKALYDATPPSHTEDQFTATLGELDRLLTAEGFTTGSLIERYQAFRNDFVIPKDKLDAVFREAIDACRERTEQHMQLPEGESFTVEYVTDKAWSGYNWYQGGFQSLIQVNTDLPIFIDRAIDLACHEGYPGHHLYNALLEKTLVRDRGWVEYSVYPLFSPQSLIAEGSANYGIEMAFPGEERVAYERDALFPLAGLDPSRAAIYHQVLALADQLSYADNEAARRYLDGEINAEQAAEWLTRYAAREPDRAAQRIQFIDKYRSYVINYNLGKDLVAAYIEAQSGDDEARRWQVFEQLLSSPRLPSGLQ
ncbi:MAG: hypothetical protein AAF657_37725 [Acidobacteriota bacterium]